MSNLPGIMGRLSGDRKVMTDANGNSVVVYKVGNRSYSMKIVKNCHTCSSPLRAEIEMALIKGASYRKISSALPEGMEVGFRSIGNHYRNNHMPVDEMYRRMLVEERAQELGLDVESQEVAAYDYMMFARAIVAQGFHNLADGELKVTAGDALAAATFLFKVEQMAGQDLDRAAMHEVLSIYYEIVREETSQETLTNIARRIEAHPRMTLLKARLSGQQDEDEEYMLGPGDVEELEEIE